MFEETLYQRARDGEAPCPVRLIASVLAAARSARRLSVGARDPPRQPVCHLPAIFEGGAHSQRAPAG